MSAWYFTSVLAVSMNLIYLYMMRTSMAGWDWDKEISNPSNTTVSICFPSYRALAISAPSISMKNMHLLTRAGA